eukprot:scaffold32781_cov32-Attheya_sp.AAC.1
MTRSLIESRLNSLHDDGKINASVTECDRRSDDDDEGIVIHSSSSSQEKEDINMMTTETPHRHYGSIAYSDVAKTRRVVVKEQVADKWALAAAQRRLHRPHPHTFQDKDDAPQPRKNQQQQQQQQQQQPWCQSICEAQSAFSQWLQQLGLIVKPTTTVEQRRRSSGSSRTTTTTRTTNKQQLPRHSLLESIATLQWAQA